MNICIVIPYFGKWPKWFDFYLETCKHNPSINWLFFTDCGMPLNKTDNVNFIRMSLQEFNHLATQKLGFKIHLKHPYNLCDLKPAYGLIFEDHLKGDDFWGYSDIDLFYGKIDHFLTKEMLNNDIITSKYHALTGHFTLYRNTEQINTLFKESSIYKKIFQSNRHFSFSEVYKPGGLSISQIKKPGVIAQFARRLRRYAYIGLSRLKSAPQPDDMTKIIKQLAHEKKIKAHFGLTIQADNMLLNQNRSDWEFEWNNGVLTDKDDELMYYHFYHLKSSSSFDIPKWGDGISKFKISQKGITY